MSQINCDACQDLRETSPEFIQNGVTDNIATSLKNNTGLNPGLTVLHTDCEDLNDINDCMIGRMVSEVEAYEVCDWKKFMKKFIQNLYETLKAIIASICGLWIRTDRLCASIDGVMRLIRSDNAASHWFTWIPAAKAKFRCINPFDDDKWGFTLQAEIREGIGCNISKKLGVYKLAWGTTDPIPPYVFAFSVIDTLGLKEKIGYIEKSAVVPTHMSEAMWKSLMRGWFTQAMYSINGNTSVYYSIRGYIVIDGVTFNGDLREEFGEDKMVLEITEMIGPSTSGSVNGISGVGMASYDI